MLDMFAIHKGMSKEQINDVIDAWVCEDVKDVKKMKIRKTMIKHIDGFAQEEGMTFYESALAFLEQESKR